MVHKTCSGDGFSYVGRRISGECRSPPRLSGKNQERLYPSMKQSRLGAQHRYIDGFAKRSHAARFDARDLCVRSDDCLSAHERAAVYPQNSLSLSLSPHPHSFRSRTIARSCFYWAACIYLSVCRYCLHTLPMVSVGLRHLVPSPGQSQV